MTNLSCFVITPLWLVALTGLQVSGDSLDVRKMTSKLLALVVLPMILAQILRVSTGVRSWAARRRTALGVGAQTGILTMVLFGAIESGPTLFQAGFAILLEMLIAVTLIHVAMYFAGYWSARGLRMTREDQIAVGFAGSQKTLMVGLQVGLDLGITVLPMVAYHVVQLLIDTVIADRLRAAGTNDVEPLPPDD